MINTIFIDKKKTNKSDNCRKFACQICQEGKQFFFTSGEIEKPKKYNLVKHEAILADEILSLMLTQYAFRRFMKQKVL